MLSISSSVPYREFNVNSLLYMFKIILIKAPSNLYHLYTAKEPQNIRNYELICNVVIVVMNNS